MAYIEFSFPSKITYGRDPLFLDFCCGKFKERIQLKPQEVENEEVEVDSLRFKPGEEEISTIEMKLSNEAEDGDEKDAKVMKIEGKCNRFRYHVDLECDGSVLRVGVYFKNFENLLSRDERFPFFPIFSSKYQFEPIMFSIITYISSEEIMKSIFCLSKYVNRVIKKMPFEEITFEAKETLNLDTTTSVQSFLKCYNVKNLVMPLMHFSQQQDLETLSLFPFPTSLVKLDIDRLDKCRCTYQNVMDILKKCRSLEKLYLRSVVVLRTDFKVETYLRENEEEMFPSLQFVKFMISEDHNEFFSLLLSKCPNLVSFQYKIFPEQPNRRTLPKPFKQSPHEVPESHGSRDIFQVSDDGFDQKYRNKWSPTLTLKYERADGHAYRDCIYLFGCVWYITLYEVKNTFFENVDAGGNVLVAAIKPYIPLEKKEGGGGGNTYQRLRVSFKVCCMNRKENNYSYFFPSSVFSRNSQEEFFCVLPTPPLEDKADGLFKNYSCEVDFQFQPILRDLMNQEQRKRQNMKKIRTMYPVGISVLDHDTAEFTVDLEEDFHRDMKGVLKYQRRFVKLGCKGVLEWCIKVYYFSKEGRMEFYIGLEEDMPCIIVADFTLVVDDDDERKNKMLATEFTSEESKGFHKIYLKIQQRKIHFYLVLEIKELIDEGMKELMVEESKRKMDVLFEKKEEYVGKTDSTKLTQVGRNTTSSNPFEEDYFTLVGNRLEWKTIFHKQFGHFKAPAFFIGSKSFSYGDDYVLEIEYGVKVSEMEKSVELRSCRRYMFGEFREWGFISCEGELGTPSDDEINLDVWIHVMNIFRKNELQDLQNKAILEFLKKVPEDQKMDDEITDSAKLVLKTFPRRKDFEKDEIKNINSQHNLVLFGVECWNFEFFPLGMEENLEKSDWIGFALYHPFMSLHPIARWIEYKIKFTSKSTRYGDEVVFEVGLKDSNISYNTTGVNYPGLCKADEHREMEWVVSIEAKILLRGGIRLRLDDDNDGDE